MKALVTRPREDAEEISAALKARGFEPVIEPLLEIRFVENGAAILAPLLEGAQAVLFTSANGVRAFAAASARRDLAVFAVGDATARAAREAGFASVESAGGAAGDLAELVRQRLQPQAGALVHPAASEAASDLAAALAPNGFELRRARLYEAVPAERLSESLAMLRAGEIDLALFFSPRTAQTFVRLAEAARIATACASVDAAVLSPAVADALKPLPWRKVIVAAAPNMPALLSAIDGAIKAPVPSPAPQPWPAYRPAPAPAALARRRRRVWPWWLATAVVATLAIAGTAPYWAVPMLPFLPWGSGGGADETQQVAALKAQLDAADAARRDAEARLTQLEHQTKASPAPAPDNASLDDLTRRVATLEQRPAGGNDQAVDAVKQSTQTLGARLDTDEAQLGKVAANDASADNDARMLALLADLRAALAGAGPYRSELAAVDALGDAGLSQKLEPLAADADKGLPNEALLAQRFAAETAPAILRAAAPKQEAASSDTGLRQEILAHVENLVRVRRIDEAPAKGDTTAQAIDAARAALASGDLGAALDALKPLSGPPADVAAPFIAVAQRRRAGEQAMASAAQAISARLAPGTH